MRIEIRKNGVELRPSQRRIIEKQLSTALNRYASRIVNVSVYLRDVNGPRGLGLKCRIVVQLPRTGRVVVVGQDAELFPLIKRTAERAGFAVRRHFNRRRSGLRRALPLVRLAG